MAKYRDPLQFPLPQSIDHEKAVLGGCIFDNTIIPKVLSELSPDDFYHTPNRMLFQAIKTLYERQEPVEFGSLSHVLSAQNNLKMVGGIDYITGLFDATPTSANTMFYVRYCKEFGNRRRLITACQSAVWECRGSEPDLPKLISDLEKSCYEVLNSRKRGGPQQFIDINTSGMQALEKRVSKGGLPGLRTGFTRLDKLTGGFRAGDLIILCARPSVGKTAFALDIACHVAVSKPVIMFSLEMGNNDIWDRSIVKGCQKVPLLHIRKGSIKDHEWDQITQVAGDLENLQLWIDDTPNLTSIEIRSRIQSVSLSSKIEPSLIIVDYLQLMKATNKSEGREQQVATISRDMKAMAKLFECPVMALCQLNREIEKRQPHEQMPRLSDLRESGAIEQDADIVIGLWRKWLITHNDNDGDHAEGGILKQRNGPIGKFDLVWDGQRATFKNHPRDQYQTDMEEF